MANNQNSSEEDKVEPWTCSRCGQLKTEGVRESFNYDVSATMNVSVYLCSACSEDARKRFGDSEYGGEGWLDAVGWPWYWPDKVDERFLEWLWEPKTSRNKKGSP